jgi:excisionase family DNA binding protein
MKPRDDATSRRILTTAEVAAYLHVSLATLCRLARKGQILAFRIGTDWRFDRGTIEKLVTDRTSEVLKEKSAAVRAAPKKTGMH